MEVYFNSSLTGVIFASAIFITAFIIYGRYLLQFWTRNNITQLEPIFPFGDTKTVFFKNEPSGICFLNLYKKFKSLDVPFGGYYFALRPELMIIDPDIIKQVMVKDFQHFTDRGNYCNVKDDPLTGHLFSLDGHMWKKLRVKLTPTFSTGKMKMMFSTLVACSNDLNSILDESYQKSVPIDTKDILSRFTTDVIGSCAFGLVCNSLKNPNSDFRIYAQQTFRPIKFVDKFRLLGSFVIPKVYKFFKIGCFNKDVCNFFIRIVKETVKYREENNITRKDFMQLLIQLKNGEQVISDDESDAINNCTTNGKKGFTIEQMTAHCFNFFLAGFETSSVTMTFCLYELVKNPEIQEKLREEITTVLKKHEDQLSYDAIMDMHYLEKVINETLRMHAPAAAINRQCIKDYQLPKSNYIIRKGDIIRIPVLGLQRDPEYYPDPEKFDPERFSKKGKENIHPFTFMPFGEGPRMCIGLRFAMMQMKVGLSVLLKNYRFTLNKKTLEPLVMDPDNFIVAPKGVIWLNVHKVTV